MHRLCHVALSAIFFSVLATNGLAQDALQAVPLNSASSTLPPIFEKGQTLRLTAKSITGNVTIVDVRGDWVLVTISPYRTQAWIRPASIDGAWFVSPYLK